MKAKTKFEDSNFLTALRPSALPSQCSTRKNELKDSQSSKLNLSVSKIENNFLKINMRHDRFKKNKNASKSNI